MKLDEAVAIRQQHLQGVEVQQHLLQQAMREIQLNISIGRSRTSAGGLEEIGKVQRARINAVLVYNLALRLGKFDDWKAST